MFSAELERNSFRTSNGEYGWTRVQVSVVVDALLLRSMAILGGEVWWVRDGSSEWVGIIPQQDGSAGVYTWETVRRTGEVWSEFVQRCAFDTLDAVGKWPREGELPSDLNGRILYNLTWVPEAEFSSVSLTHA